MAIFTPGSQYPIAKVEEAGGMICATSGINKAKVLGNHSRKTFIFQSQV
jgi:hypothetical protein